MATILMGWELGEGLGHVQHLLKVARPLAAEGHRIVFALCNVAEPWPLFQKDSFVILQAPYWNFRPWREAHPFVASSFADVLAVRGWETIGTLLPLVQAWQNLIDVVRPQFVVAEFAPTLCLAAHGSLPVVQVSSWFALPPAHTATFPLLVSGQTPVVPQAELLTVVQEVQRRRGRAVPQFLTSVSAADDRFVMTFPDLDPYQAERAEPVWDQFEVPAGPVKAAPEGEFFAYLTADNPNTEPFLVEMALTGYRGTVFLRGAPDALKIRLRLQGLVVLERPAPLEEILSRFAVIVHHGGTTTAGAAFAAGRPQIMFPQHLEQLTNAQMLARLGVGLFLLSNAAPMAAARALRQVLVERRHVDAAVGWASRLQQRPRRPALPAVLERCRHYLRGNS